MNSQLKSRTGKTLVLSSGNTIAALGAIVLAMVLSRLFSKAEWATYRQTFLVFTLAAPLLGMGLSSALFYFLPNQKQRNRGLLLENLIPLAIAGVCYLLFMVLGGNLLIARLFDNPMLRTTLIIMAPIAIFQLVIGCVGPCLIASERVLGAAIFSVFARTSVVVAVLVAVCFSPSVLTALWVQIVVLGVISIAAISLMLSVCTNGKPTLRGIMPQLAYGVPLGFSSMVGIFSRNVDRTMVSSFCNLDDYAIFENGALELPLVGIITGSMTSILLVDYRKMLAEEGRKKEILPLLHRAMLKSGSVLIPMMFLLLCIAPEFMVCMFGEKYRESAAVFRVYLLLLPVRTLVFGSIALAAGRTRELAIVPIVTILVNVVLNYFALTYFGYIGCAYATVFVIYFVSALGRALIAQRILECSLVEFIPWRRLAQLMFISAIPVPAVVAVLLLIGNTGDLGEQGNFNDLVRVLGATLAYACILIPISNRMGFIQVSQVRERVLGMFRK